MNLRQYLLFMSIGAMVSFSAWAIILLAINPLSAGVLAMSVFYITLGGAIIGFATILGTLVRMRGKGDEAVTTAVARSLRQAALLTVLIIGCLFLLTKDLFTPLSVILFVAVLAVFEFFFLAAHKERT